MSNEDQEKSSHCGDKKRKSIEGVEIKLKKKSKWDWNILESDEEHFGGSHSDQEDLAEGWTSNKEHTSYTTSNIEQLASLFLIKSSKVKAVLTGVQEVASEVDILQARFIETLNEVTRLDQLVKRITREVDHHKAGKRKLWAQADKLKSRIEQLENKIKQLESKKGKEKIDTGITPRKLIV